MSGEEARKAFVGFARVTRILNDDRANCARRSGSCAESQRRLIVARADVTGALFHGPIHQGTWLQPVGSTLPV